MCNFLLLLLLNFCLLMSTENDGGSCTTSNDPTNCDICSGPDITENNPGPPCTCDSGWRGDACEIGELIQSVTFCDRRYI